MPLPETKNPRPPVTVSPPISQQFPSILKPCSQPQKSRIAFAPEPLSARSFLGRRRLPPLSGEMTRSSANRYCPGSIRTSCPRWHWSMADCRSKGASAVPMPRPVPAGEAYRTGGSSPFSGSSPYSTETVSRSISISHPRAARNPRYIVSRSLRKKISSSTGISNLTGETLPSGAIVTATRASCFSNRISSLPPVWDGMPGALSAREMVRICSTSPGRIPSLPNTPRAPRKIPPAIILEYG